MLYVNFQFGVVNISAVLKVKEKKVSADWLISTYKWCLSISGVILVNISADYQQNSSIFDRLYEIILIKCN